MLGKTAVGRTRLYDLSHGARVISGLCSVGRTPGEGGIVSAT